MPVPFTTAHITQRLNALKISRSFPEAQVPVEWWERNLEVVPRLDALLVGDDQVPECAALVGVREGEGDEQGLGVVADF